MMRLIVGGEVHEVEEQNFFQGVVDNRISPSLEDVTVLLRFALAPMSQAARKHAFSLLDEEKLQYLVDELQRGLIEKTNSFPFFQGLEFITIAQRHELCMMPGHPVDIPKSSARQCNECYKYFCKHHGRIPCPLPDCDGNIFLE